MTVAAESQLLAPSEDTPVAIPPSGGPKASEGGKLPPMLAQYLEYSAQYPDAVILFQVGDFYEIFFEHAVLVSRTLNLTLTTRDKNAVNPVPMCGVPIGVVDGYVDRLVAAGISVALVSQVGEVTGKGMVTRALERIVTPGIRVLNNASGACSSPAVAALYPLSNDEAVLAISAIESGVIEVVEHLAIASIGAELRRFELGELIVPASSQGKRLDRRLTWVREVEQAVGAQSLKFRPERTLGGEHRLQQVNGFSVLTPGSQRAVRLLVDYVDEVTVHAKLPIRSVAARQTRAHMSIDAMTRRNLELLRNARDAGTEGTLFGFMNRTITPAGGRLLRQWIAEPLLDVAAIGARHRAVGRIIASGRSSEDLRKALRYVPDLERIAARIELNVVGPRELGALRDAVEAFPDVAAIVRAIVSSEADPILTPIAEQLIQDRPWGQLLISALADEVPVALGEGTIFRAGFDSELDARRLLKTDGAAVIAALEGRERERTGISSLKIKYNSILGFFIEITKTHQDRVAPDYIARQHTTNAQRYTTPELRALESKVLGADAAVRSQESQLYTQLKRDLLPHVEAIRELNAMIATLDCLAALSEVAIQHNLVAPEMVDTTELIIEQGRHPVIAELLAGRFVPNSLEFGAQGKRCIILTGPNMGGKSTYLRQAALIVVMAQMGSFVPAERAVIGIVDQVFARLGASDNLADGESTFMVEMREVAHIVQNATERSLVLIDEVGRGTATLDGVSLAQAILEWLLTKISARTLCATHFHELTALSAQFPSVQNLSVGSVDRDGEVFFTHEIRPGAANRSYGLEVARLTGLPRGLLDRAWQLLRTHEEVLGAENRRAGVQLSLFRPPAPEPRVVVEAPRDYQPLRELADQIAAVNPDTLSPRAALDLVFDLVQRAERLRGEAKAG